jgi:hypothetical protein
MLQVVLPTAATCQLPLPPGVQNTLRIPAIARIKNSTNNTRNRPARNFAMANDAPAIDVKPRTAAMMPTTRNSSANQLRGLCLDTLEVVVSAFVIAAEVDVRLFHQLVITERVHIFTAGGFLVHGATKLGRLTGGCCRSCCHAAAGRRSLAARGAPLGGAFGRSLSSRALSSRALSCTGLA